MGTNTIREPGRRALLRAGLTVAAGSAALVAAKPGDHQGRRMRVVFDVACLIDTMRIVAPVDANHPGTNPTYGTPFLVEGNMYPEGTIPRGVSGWDPDSAAPIGLWACRGWVMEREERPQPVGLTTQSYFFGSFDRDDVPSAPDQLTSEGVEGGVVAGWRTVRPVVGGIGRYAGARGTCVQEHIGENTTSYGLVLMPGPNFSFIFDIEISPSAT